MAIICQDLKLIYIMVGGTGCTSIGSILQEKFGGRMIPEKNIAGIDSKHNTLEQLVKHQIISEKELKSYLKVANIRNPFDLVVTKYARLQGTSLEQWLHQQNSWVYKSKHYPKLLKKQIQFAREAGFEKWILREYSWKSRAKAWLKYYLSNRGYLLGQKQIIFTKGVDQYIRFERLEDDFNAVLQQLGIQDRIFVPNTNPTQGKKSYQSYYTPKSRQLIEDVFSQELTQFGYHFEENSEI